MIVRSSPALVIFKPLGFIEINMRDSLTSSVISGVSRRPGSHTRGVLVMTLPIIVVIVSVLVATPSFFKAARVSTDLLPLVVTVTAVRGEIAYQPTGDAFLVLGALESR